MVAGRCCRSRPSLGLLLQAWKAHNRDKGAGEGHRRGAGADDAV
jgi:hypothetical protein